MKSASDNDEQEKKTLEFLKNYEASELTYPPELLKARRAAFLAQVDQLTSANPEPELAAEDQEIVDLLRRLRPNGPGYPADLLAARRSAFLGQLARANRLTWWERLQQSLPRIPAPAAGLRRTSLALAVLAAAAWIGSWLFLRAESSLRPAPVPGLATPTAASSTGVYEASLLLCQPGDGAAPCSSPALESGPDLASEAPAVSSQALAPAAYANDDRSDTSWVSQNPDGWIKVDLGRPTSINSVTFRKGSAGPSTANDPGQFVVAVALADAHWQANGQNDPAQYAQVFDSQQSGFSGQVGTTETVRVVFPTVKARFVKITFQRAGAAIDGLGVFMVQPPAVVSSPTQRSSAQDTRTPLPTATRVVTQTLLPSPTATRLPTDTPPPSPTETLAPSETPLPTLTDTVPPSETPIPLPTETATPFFVQPLPSDTAPAPTVELPVESLAPILVSGHNQNLILSCAGEAVEVSGNNNIVTLLGSCSSITVTGNHNQVFWQSGAPIVTNEGNENIITQE